MTTLLITGSRAATMPMLHYAKRIVARAAWLDWRIIVGDAEGIDQAVIQACHDNRLDFAVYGIAKQPRHICCAAHMADCYYRVQGDFLFRDRHMVHLLDKETDRVMAIWDGKSRGTKYTGEYAAGLGIQVDWKVFAAETA